MKRCSKCGVDKPLDAFSPFGPARPGKLKSACKVCAAEKARKHYVDAGGYARVRERRNPVEHAETMRKWRAANPERWREIARKAARRQLATRAEEINERRRADRTLNPGKHKRWAKARYERARAKIIASTAAWRRKNRERMNEASRRRRAERGEEYRAIRRAEAAKRKSVLLRAIPLWADLALIKRIYRDCPRAHHVDHLVPLTSELVCGLHCEANLQYLPARENVRKHNKWWPDGPMEGF